MVGGAGDDVFVFDNAADVAIELEGGGSDKIQSSVTVLHGFLNVETIELVGSANNDVFAGPGDEHVTGNDGNNTLAGGGGGDELLGGAGDDRLIFDPLDTQIAGQVGEDTLVLALRDQSLDLASVSGTVLTGIERIDLGAAGGQSLSVTPQAVLDLSDSSDALWVLGTELDSVSATPGPSWTPAGTVEVDGNVYNVLQAGAATVYVDADILLQ
jgi:Ca2+-binding RTX toxin-like protein